ncbi:Nicotinamide/nicotinic acid mononucleotide adenylyltransferase 1 [Mactra antiquata]
MWKMATPQKVVLLACGSFNPPTIMHLRLFEIARDELQRAGKYDVIAGIMSPVSDAYKKKDLAPATQRCDMVKLALKTSRWVRLDTWESEQPQWSTTVKVLRHHKTILDNQSNTTIKCTPSKKRKKDMKNEDNIEKGSPTISNNKDTCKDNVQLKLLCGGDLLESFAVPGLWAEEDIEEIITNYGLVCITRHGSDPRKFIYDSDVLTRLQDHITIVTEWIQQDISSTKIRTALRRNQSVKYLIQDSVIDFIRENGMYGVDKDNKYSDKVTPSPMSDIMEYVETSFPNETITIISTRETQSKTLRVTKEKPEDEQSRSPRRIQTTTSALSRGMSPSSSPRRMMEDNDSDPDGSNSPKTPPQNVACLTDIGSIVRRVKNYNVQGLFHPKKIQPK